MVLRRVFVLPSLVVCELDGVYNLFGEFSRASEHLKELLPFNIRIASDQLDMVSVYTKSKTIQSLESSTLTDIRDDTIETMTASIDL